MDLNTIIIDYLEAAAPILSALAWPAAIVVVLLMFRQPLRDALQHVIEASWGSAKVKFDRASPSVTESVVEALEGTNPTTPADAASAPVPLREYFADKIESNPLNVLLESYIAVEQWYLDALAKHGFLPENGRTMGVPRLSRIAVEKGMLPTSTLNAVEGLSTLRNLAVHAPGRAIDADTAREYVTLADAVLYSLRAGLAHYERTHPPTGDGQSA